MPELYRAIYRIRRFEETVLDNFPRGVFFGTTHTYLGQEANAVGVLSCLEAKDIVFSNHRCHGHFLARGGDPRSLFAELMGRATGVCGGRGGSQHLCWENFYSNGVQGGIVPAATGMAMAEKMRASGAITVVFLGDGTLGEGVIYETFNMASLWKAPILFVLENNGIAQTTPTSSTLAGEPRARFTAFGIPVKELDTSDVEETNHAAQLLVGEVRSSGSPCALILNTCRFGPHSKGDDTRDTEQVAKLKRERDPLTIREAVLDPKQTAQIRKEVDTEIETAFQTALQDPFPTLED